MASQGRDTEHRRPQHEVKQPAVIAKLERVTRTHHKTRNPQTLRATTNDE